LAARRETCGGRNVSAAAILREAIVESSVARSGGKKEQGPTATLVFLAFLAMWFV
jgi:hypothetical protein